MLQPNFTWHIYSASDIVFCIALWTRNFLPECSSKFLLCYFLDIPERRPILQSCVDVYHDGCNSSGPYFVSPKGPGEFMVFCKYWTKENLSESKFLLQWNNQGCTD